MCGFVVCEPLRSSPFQEAGSDNRGELVVSITSISRLFANRPDEIGGDELRFVESISRFECRICCVG